MRTTMKKILLILALVMVAAAFQSVLLAQAASPHVVVNAFRLNVRSGPGAGHDIITVVAGGTVLPVTMLSHDRDWYEVATSAGAGWVHRKYAVDRGDWSGVPRAGTPMNPGGGTAIPADAPHLVVNASYLNVRSGPGVSHNIIATARGGTVLAVLSIAADGKWYEVNTAQGPGWVNSNYTAGRGDFSGVTRQAQADPWSGDTPRAVISTGRLNIRTGPGIGNSVVTDVPWRTTLAVNGVSADGNWFLVEGSFGSGWLRNRYVVFRGDYSQVPVVG